MVADNIHVYGVAIRVNAFELLLCLLFTLLLFILIAVCVHVLNL